MQEYGIIDYKRDRKRKTQALVENLQATKKVEYLTRVMEGKIPDEHRQKGAYKKALREWHKKKGHTKVTFEERAAICPKCNRPMKKSLAEAQIKNKRPEGIECMACIMGIPRRKK